MKKLTQFISESKKDFLFEELLKATDEPLNEGLIKKIMNFFGAGLKTAQSKIINKWKSEHPEWAKNYEEIQKTSDEETARKNLDKQLATIDNDSKLDDKTKIVCKIVVLCMALQTAQDKKLKNLEKYCGDEIGKYAKSNPEETKEAKAEMNGDGDGNNEGDVKNPAQATVEDPQTKKATQQLAAALGINNDTYEKVAKKLQGLLAECLNENKFNTDDWHEFFKMINKEDAEHGNEAILALLLAFEKLTTYGVDIDGVIALLTKYNAAKEVELFK